MVGLALFHSYNIPSPSILSSQDNHVTPFILFFNVPKLNSGDKSSQVQTMLALGTINPMLELLFYSSGSLTDKNKSIK